MRATPRTDALLADCERNHPHPELIALCRDFERELEAIRGGDNLGMMVLALREPARELLYLYDWRPELAKMEAELRNDGTDAQDKVKEVRRLLREYGERKKAGWIALRAALDETPKVLHPKRKGE